MAHKVKWIDGKAEPQCPPNPAYPAGIDLDVSPGATRTCKVDLPYPAKRIGRYEVRCKVCGASVACTTAGRPDDPRSITMPCRLSSHATN